MGPDIDRGLHKQKLLARYFVQRYQLEHPQITGVRWIIL